MLYKNKSANIDDFIKNEEICRFSERLKFIDIHTHNANDDKRVFRLFNLAEAFDRIHTYPYCSIGLHPWYLEKEELENAYKQLAQAATSANVLAIGECGLDRLCETPFALQEDAFGKQIHLANAISKPLIIHCVKAYDAVHKHLQRNKSRVPVIFHGFHKKAAVANNVLKQGYYLSFGTYLLHDQAIEAYRACPLDRLFLETDDSTDVSMVDLYTYAAQLKNVTVEQLQHSVSDNFKTLFPFNTI